MRNASQLRVSLNRYGLFGGAVLSGLILLLPPPEGLSLAAVRCAAVAVLMATWWMTEAVPLAATALLPLVLFPVLGIMPGDEAAAPYSNPLIYLFLGGFFMAAALQRWGLHRRFALTVLALVGSSPRRIVLGFLLATAFISMWVSNTATAMLMISIALSVPALVAEGEESPPDGLAAAIGLAVAYGATVGGVGTIIGTPPNAFFVGFMQAQYGVRVGFGQWMIIGVPVMLVGLCLVYAVILWMHPMSAVPSQRSRDHIRRELRAMGRLARPEIVVLLVFGTVAAAWIAGPLIRVVVPGLSDTGIALIGALALLVIPADATGRTPVLSWEDAERLPWGVLLIFGGGLSLAGAIQQTGLAAYVGSLLQGTAILPTLAVAAAVAGLVLLVTELTSNIAAAATFLPIAALLAGTRGDNPFLLTVPTVLAASCAFMLPVGTPPNAIVFGSGMVTQRQMIRAGVVLNLGFLVLVALLPYLLAPAVFGRPGAP